MASSCTVMRFASIALNTAQRVRVDSLIAGRALRRGAPAEPADGAASAEVDAKVSEVGLRPYGLCDGRADR
jgi:hypothetical protein